MAEIIKLGIQGYSHTGYRTLPEILAQEQAAFAARMRAKNMYLSARDLAMASAEDRMGAALLRLVLNRADIVLMDDEAVVMRVVVPASLLVDLECWGACGEDSEGCELEYFG